MNLPFGLAVRKETAPKKKEEPLHQEHALEQMLEQKLDQYRAILEEYKRCIMEYAVKLESYEKNSSDNRLVSKQTAQDINYLKEQEEKVVEMLFNLSKMAEEIKAEASTRSQAGLDSISISFENIRQKLEDTKLSLDGLDKNVVNRLSELLLDLQKQNYYQSKQNQTELVTGLDTLTRKVKKNQTLLWISFILNIFGLGAMALLILYIMEIIPF
jgi:archaellum component FlaC